ncbi:MAG: zinc ribbon domain-containing protein [Clostridia bacterium]|nr:zinc ribbon domain-containing protein [Clostridia bacterium]
MERQQVPHFLFCVLTELKLYEYGKFCSECGSSITEDATYCPRCGKAVGGCAITTANESGVLASPSEINTVEDMENYLQELSKHANESAEAALKAQLQVIRYAQSPELYDSSFDMLFKCIKNALKYAESPKMQEQIRERATILIQNYIFFMNARLQFEVAINRKQYNELMEEACNKLAESTAEVVESVLSSQNDSLKDTTDKDMDESVIMTKAITTTLKNLLNSKDSNGDSLLARAYRWWTKETRTREKEGEFMQTVSMLTTKLYKQREIIGKSDLVAGIIERYAEGMTEHSHREKLNAATYYCTEVNNKARNSELTAFGLIIGGNILVLLIRWIFKGIGNSVSYISAKIAEEEYVADATHWAQQQWLYTLALFAFVSFIILILYLYNRKKAKTALAIAEKEYDDTLQNYLNIAAEFEE